MALKLKKKPTLKYIFLFYEIIRNIESCYKDNIILIYDIKERQYKIFFDDISRGWRFNQKLTPSRMRPYDYTPVLRALNEFNVS